MRKRVKELWNRLCLWFEKDKHCRHCCLLCEYYKMCSDE